MNKLEQRMKEYEIPAIPGLPTGKVILVYRLPPVEKTAGGLYLAQTDQDQQDVGVLVAAGLGARDVMADHLIEVGDLIWFGRFAGTGAEKIVERNAAERGKRLIAMKVEDIQLSVDALERLKEYEIKRDEESGEHYYERKSK